MTPLYYSALKPFSMQKTFESSQTASYFSPVVSSGGRKISAVGVISFVCSYISIIRQTHFWSRDLHFTQRKNMLSAIAIIAVFGSLATTADQCEVKTANGKISCSSSTGVCTHSCDAGYYAARSKNSTISSFVLNSTCLKTKEWSVDVPACKPIICLPFLESPGNGSLFCTNSNLLDSVCTFQCNKGFVLSGKPKITCEEYGLELKHGVWSSTASVCAAKVCMPPRTTLKHGSVTCTDENRVNSVCTFECTDPGYHLNPRRPKRNKCQPNTQWNKPEPCCSRPCPPNARMDVFFVLDSSVGAWWYFVTEFMEGMLRSFIISEEATNFAVIRYNTEVETATQILLKDYRNSKVGISKAFTKIKAHDSLAAGANTGKALTYVAEYMMAASAGNRPDFQDFVIVITDGRSMDEVLGPADILREMDATILAIGVPPPRGAPNAEKLLEIGGKNYLGIFEADWETQTNLLLRLIDKLCGDYCY